jgi:6,7-dimethyl-8-ribityllumazine synthase
LAKKQNLSDVELIKHPKAAKWKVGVITAEWNPEITSKLTEGCISHLNNEGVTEDNIINIDVPGTFEIPVAAKMLLQKYPGMNAIIGIGCVIKGETSHNEYINNSVATGLTQLSLVSGKPCIFGVLTPNDMQQAIDRSGGTHGNKGIEAAATAIKMIAIEEGLNKKKTTIGF